MLGKSIGKHAKNYWRRLNAKSYRLDADVLEQSFTKLPAGTIGELVEKLLDYPMDTPISIYRASGSADLYLDSISDIEIDYEDTGGIILC